MSDAPNEPVHAPELGGGAAWLNTERPLSCGPARQGRPARLLDLLLHQLHAHASATCATSSDKYPDALVVIGVHSAKFSHEKDAENIRQAILRHDIDHPVVDDRRVPHLERVRACSAWPTLVLIDPEGNVRRDGVRRGPRDELIRSSARLIADRRARQGERSTDQPLSHERRLPTRRRRRRLCFPGKVLADAAATACSSPTRTTIACSSADLDGHIRTSSAPATAAGPRGRLLRGTPRSTPQGMALDGRHALRRRHARTTRSAPST